MAIEQVEDRLRVSVDVATLDRRQRVGAQTGICGRDNKFPQAG